MRRDIQALTGLRAVAAGWVVLYHFRGLADPYLGQLPLVRTLITVGWTGVELFFVLSGLVITLAYIDQVGTRPTPRVVGTFLYNRFARVWPAWAVVTVVMAGYLWAMRRGGLDTDLLAPHPVADAAHLLRQLTMTQLWGTDDIRAGSYVLPGWSISAEWAAYVAFPLLAVLIRPLRSLPAGVLLLLAVLAISPLSVEAFTEGTLDFEQSWVSRIACCFMAGMLTALAVRRLPTTPRVESAGLAVSVTALALVPAGISWAAWRQAGDPTHDYSGVIVVLFPVLVAGLCLTQRGPARWLASRPMVYGGKISYCLYLVHFVVLDVAVALWWQGADDRFRLTPGLALAVPGLILLSLVASAGLHHGVEEPARRLLMAALRGRPAVARRSKSRPVRQTGTALPLAVSDCVTRDRVEPLLADHLDTAASRADDLATSAFEAPRPPVTTRRVPPPLAPLPPRPRRESAEIVGVSS